MSKPRHLSWENFRATIWHEGQQRSHRIGQKPSVEVFGDAINGRIGLLVQLAKNAEIPKEIDRLVFINGRILKRKNGYYLELATASQTLHRQFYQFATAVADRIIMECEVPLAAAVAELKCFDELLAPRSLLSLERQIGLLGELIVLERIIVSRGPAGADAWTGPQSEPHDFRLGQTELEVKTSSGTRRLHRIHGLDQMFPSTGMKLSLVIMCSRSYSEMETVKTWILTSTRRYISSLPLAQSLAPVTLLRCEPPAVTKATISFLRRLHAMLKRSRGHSSRQNRELAHGGQSLPASTRRPG